MNGVSQKLIDLFNATQKREALVLIFLMFIGMVLEMLGVGIVIPALNLVSNPDYLMKFPLISDLLEPYARGDSDSLLVTGICLLISVYTLKTVFLVYLSWRQTKFVFGLQAQMSQNLFAKYLQQPYIFHLHRNSAQLIRNVANETTQLANGSITTGMTLVTEILVLSGIVSLLLFFEPMGAMIVASTLGASGILFYFLTKNPVLKWGDARQQHEGLRIQHIQQGLGGIKDIKLLGREKSFLSKYDFHNQEYARVGRKQTILLNIPRIVIELVAIIALGMLSLTLLIQGKSIAELVPILGMFGAAAFRLMPSINRVLGNWQTFRYSMPIIETLSHEMSLACRASPASANKGCSIQKSISVKNLTFAYPDSKQSTLKNINIEIFRGTSVGFIGGSGAGKSSLIDLILGLLAPSGGSVLVDGKDIQSNLQSWQKQIGYVPQTIYLTDDSLRRNVAFGLLDEHISETAVRRAISAAQLEEFVDSLPRGLDTIVGERGVRLSGGQRQRIGVARALYHDPEVLVLDEATSALDRETEKGVMEAVRNLHGIKTILIIAHRLSTVAYCDRIYRLEMGEIVQEGTADMMISAEREI